MQNEKRVIAVGVCLLLVSVSFGCAGKKAPPKKEPPSVIGRWEIDNHETVEQTMVWLEAEGVQRRISDKPTRAMYGEMNMFYEFYDDGTFLCHQSNSELNGNFTGAWNLTGARIVADQTHQDGEPWEDQMYGKVEGDIMKLCHQQPIGLARIIMNRVIQDD